MVLTGAYWKESAMRTHRRLLPWIMVILTVKVKVVIHRR